MSVMDVVTARDVFQIIRTIGSWVAVDMVDLFAFRTRPDESCGDQSV